MKYLLGGIILFWAAFLLSDLLFSEGRGGEKRALDLTFIHELHGENIGLDCSHCHSGVKMQARAYMPSKADCMDCHRLPLTENPGIEKLDSALKLAPEHPWKHESVLPENVVFHHGVHSAAGVTCADCHSGAKGNSMSDRYGLEKFTMKDCLDCHRGNTFKDRFKPAATYCGACHR